jgi:hypothetical protein
LLRIVAPGAAAVVVVIACVAFPKQTTAVVMDAAENRAVQIVKVMEASLAPPEQDRDARSARLRHR